MAVASVHVKMTFLKTVDEQFSEGYKHNGVSRFPLAQPIFNPIVLHSSPPPSGSFVLDTERDFVEAGEFLVKTGFDPDPVYQLMHTLREASKKIHDCIYSS
jgi:hypothetical protein